MKHRRALAVLVTLSLLVGQAGALSLEQARFLVEKLYLDEVPEEVLQRDTIEGIFDGLDKYSTYLPPENYSAFWGTINEVPQIGLGLLYGYTEDRAAVEIAEVYDGGAAHKAGMVPGDKVTHVGGNAVADSTDLNAVADWMRGEEGTAVTLRVLRADGSQVELELVRCPFTIPYTTYSLEDGHIGYIDCDSIGQETYGHIVEALEDIGDEVDVWVLDLRGNSGGLTAEAAQVAGVFSGKGPKTLMRQKGEQYYTFDAHGEHTTVYPVIALVDGSTASAAEQIAGDIRDQTAGMLIGTRTYGKGVAQTIVDESVEPGWFPEGDAVRITSSRFYSFNGLTNDKVGVLPHLLVEPGYEEGVSYLLCTGKSEEGPYLKVKIGAWHWYVDLTRALEDTWRPAFVELLEALDPQASMVYYDTDEAGITTPAALAERLGLTEFTPTALADSGESPYAYELERLFHYGVLWGDETGNCNPEAPLTRAQMCALLSQFLRYTVAEESRFSDVPADAWYAPSVNAMARLGLVQSVGGDRFDPDGVLTHEQFITILARTAAWLNVEYGQLLDHADELMEGVEGLEAYSAWSQRGAWLLGRTRQNMLGEYVGSLWADVAEIDPAAVTTREEAACGLWRMLDDIGMI